jgi:predicted transglutaminase-like cysteine proteinase
VVDSAAATRALPDKNGCLLFSGSCMTSAIRAEALLDDARREELRKVNATVNEQMGTLDDYFASFDKKASVPMFMIEQDCSDCAAIKRRELIGLGWPPRGLRVGYALTGNGDLQKVLIIETDGGSVVLGNAAHRASGKTASMAL